MRLLLTNFQPRPSVQRGSLRWHSRQVLCSAPLTGSRSISHLCRPSTDRPQCADKATTSWHCAAQPQPSPPILTDRRFDRRLFWSWLGRFTLVESHHDTAHRRQT
jgi:hypothetical protein